MSKKLLCMLQPNCNVRLDLLFNAHWTVATIGRLKRRNEHFETDVVEAEKKYEDNINEQK